MGRYFQITVVPDMIDGTVANVIASNGNDKPFSSSDILFDWTAFDVPKGASKLESVTASVMGQDGGVQVVGDIFLVFAKSVNTEAPTSLGTVNGAQSACFDLPTHYIGGVKLEGTTAGQGVLVGPAFGTIYTQPPGSANGSPIPTQILQGEPDSGTNVGYDKLYVAAFTNGNLDFSTGVLSDGGETSDTETSLTTKTVDPRKCFQVGDTVYIHDVDTAIGTVKSMTATNITLNAVIGGGTDIADEDEFVNANPIRIHLGFEK